LYYSSALVAAWIVAGSRFRTLYAGKQVPEQAPQLVHGLQVPSLQWSHFFSPQEATSDFTRASHALPPNFGRAFTALLLRFVPPPHVAEQSSQDSQSAHSQSTASQSEPVRHWLTSCSVASHGANDDPELATLRFRFVTP